MNRRELLVSTGAGIAGMGIGATGTVLASSQQDSDRTRSFEAAGPDLPRGTHRMIWSIETDQPYLALTFDDGPDPDFTPRVLEILQKYKIQATFPVMGFNVEKNPALLDATLKAGHEIANHTWTHQRLSLQDDKVTKEQLHRCHDIIRNYSDTPLRFFRAPRGEVSGSCIRYAQEIGYTSLLWSVTRGPGKETNPRHVASYMSKTVRPGSIVLLHDGIGAGTFNRQANFARELHEKRSVEVKALPEFIERTLESGMKFVTVSKLADIGK